MARERLNYLHDTSGLSWREIARLDDYNGIPPGTLCTFAKTGYLPYKWRSRFGLPLYKSAPACAECGEVHVIAGICIKRQPIRIVRRRTRRQYRDLWEIPRQDLLAALMNRKEF